MSKKISGIRLFITDLDNTLYDWYSSFVPAFYAMVEVATRILDVDEEQLLDEIKIIHEKYHNSEQPFAILETPAVQRKLPNSTLLERKELLEEAFVEFSKVRKERLCLFPGVRETLEEIREFNCLVVGHTEAVVENSLYRLQLLSLVTAFDRIYAPSSRSQGHPDPSRPKIHESFGNVVSLLPSEHRKPDPAVLMDICNSFEVAPHQTLYVGDSMTRDIGMAAMTGTFSALATYGGRCPVELWQKLVRVTHWTDYDVRLEERLREEFAHLKPDVELERFSDVLRYFEFECSPSAKPLREGRVAGASWR